MGSSATRFLPVPPDDAEEVMKSTNFTRGEIDYLYERFRDLGEPAGRVRYLIRNDFGFHRTAIHTIIYREMFGLKNRITFVDFAAFLNNFKVRATRLTETAQAAIKVKKLKLLFSMYDINKDGNINKEDLMEIVYRLYSKYMDIQTMVEVVNAVMKEMDTLNISKILFNEFCTAMEPFDMDLLVIKFPTL